MASVSVNQPKFPQNSQVRYVGKESELRRHTWHVIKIYESESRPDFDYLYKIGREGPNPKDPKRLTTKWFYAYALENDLKKSIPHPDRDRGLKKRKMKGGKPIYRRKSNQRKRSRNKRKRSRNRRKRFRNRRRRTSKKNN